MGLKQWKVRALDDSSFLEGRVAGINVKKKLIGIVGEIHPQVLNNFGLENPVVAFEIDLGVLID